MRLGCDGVACPIAHFIAAPGLLEVNKNYFGLYEVQCTQAEMTLRVISDISAQFNLTLFKT